MNGMHLQSRERKNLELLMSGYFHQDWDFEADSVDKIVELFLSSESKETIGKAINELMLLLKERGEMNHGFLVTELGCYYDPGAEGHTPRQWLLSLLEKLQRGNGLINSEP